MARNSFECIGFLRESTEDLIRSGPARVAASDENVRRLKTALRRNRRITHSLDYHKVPAQQIS